MIALLLPNVYCAWCIQLEFQRVIRATLELPPATKAELEMLAILTRGSGGCPCKSQGVARDPSLGASMVVNALERARLSNRSL